MKRLIYIISLLATTGLQAQVLNVNTKNGAYLPIETTNTQDITFNETLKTVDFTLKGGVQHSFYTESLNSISSRSDNSNKLTYNLDPKVIFDEKDKNNFNEIKETIIRDVNNDAYDDFVENYTVNVFVYITFSENSVSVSGDINHDIKDNTHLTINSSSENVGYIVSGNCSNGSLKIYNYSEEDGTEEKFQIMLSGLNLTNPFGPAINIQTGKTVYFTIDDNTTNNLCDGPTYNAPIIGSGNKEEDQKGTLFSEGQLIFNGYEDGTGILNVTSYGGHAICSDDYIIIRSGNINIKQALKDGFHTNDKFIVTRTENASPKITVNATNDGIDCGKGEVVIDAGLLELTTGGEAIKVEYKEDNSTQAVTPNATINGGYIKFVTTGDKSSGIKVTGTYKQTGGIIHGTVKGNGSKILNCDSNITFSGGKLIGLSQGTVYNDETSAGGIKSEGKIEIQNSTIAIECTDKGAKGINTDNDVTIRKGSDITLLSTGENHKGNAGTRKSISIDAGNLTIATGNVKLRSYDNAISAVNTSILDGTLHAISDSDIAIDATIEQYGGWIMTKDSK